MIKRQELLSPLNDLVFKALFGREQKECKIILMDFLNAVLATPEDDRIIDITYMNPFNQKEYQGDKLSILDIKVKTQKEERINIEVQVSNVDNFRKRSLYYWSKIYSETIAESEVYETLKKTIVINLLDFSLIHETDKYHTVYKLLEREEKFMLVDDLEIHYIELSKFDIAKEIESMDALELWFTFMKEAGREWSHKELEKLRERSDKVNMAVEMLKKISADEKLREEYYAREKSRLDAISRIKYAEMKGLEKGLEKGILEGKIRTVKNFLKLGIPVEQAAIAAELPVEEVIKLKEEAEG